MQIKFIDANNTCLELNWEKEGKAVVGSSLDSLENTGHEEKRIPKQGCPAVPGARAGAAARAALPGGERHGGQTPAQTTHRSPAEGKRPLPRGYSMDRKDCGRWAPLQAPGKAELLCTGRPRQPQSCLQHQAAGCARLLRGRADPPRRRRRKPELPAAAQVRCTAGPP